MIRKSFVILGVFFSACGLCSASSYTGVRTGCAHDDCHPMNGMGESLEQFMKMEEEVFSSLKCFGNHLNDLEKLDMKLSIQENYIRFIRSKLQGLIHGNFCISNGCGGVPNLQNNLNSQTVVNNNTTMNTTNNTCINNNFSQSVQQQLPEELESLKAEIEKRETELNELKKVRSAKDISKLYAILDAQEKILDAHTNGLCGNNNPLGETDPNLDQKYQELLEQNKQLEDQNQDLQNKLLQKPNNKHISDLAIKNTKLYKDMEKKLDDTNKALENALKTTKAGEILAQMQTKIKAYKDEYPNQKTVQAVLDGLAHALIAAINAPGSNPNM